MHVQLDQQDIYLNLPERTEDGLDEIREVIRDFFESAPLDAHGTSLFGSPESISKAGCLALAKKGCLYWNEWRKAFPVSSSGENAANFSGYDFTEVEIRFAGFDFGGFVDFSHCIFPGGILSFFGSKFGDYCDFRGARFGDGCTFDKSNFEGRVCFIGSQFGLNTSFHKVEFCADVNFLGAQFGPNTQFLGCVFKGWVNFSASSWEQLKELNEWGDDQFAKVRQFSRRLNVSPDSFWQIDFRGTQFLGYPAKNGETSLDFSNRKFLARLDFSPLDGSPVKFASVPKFHGCEFHQDTSFEDALFPGPSGNDKAARAYRAIKLAFSKLQAIREEQRFFRLEMDEEKEGHRIKGRDAIKKALPYMALREGGTWILYWLYKQASDYGFSVTKPFLVLVMLWLLFAQIYGSYTGVERCYDIWRAHCEIQGGWLSYSLQQALPLPGFNKLKPAIDGVSVAWVAFHKTLSIAAVFLIGLALRNLFKLK